jgi:5'-nucleotidase
LFNGTDYPALDRPAATYPVVVTQTGGHQVLIVQASAYTKYVGDITLYFDDEGIIQSWSGNPIYMGPEVVQDPEVLEAIRPWKEIVDAEGKRIVGSIKFTASSSGCYSGDCLMGNLQADAMAYAAFLEDDEGDGAWAYATIAITNPGGVRGSLAAGELSYSNLVTTTPFENTCDKMEVQGKFIREALEFSARYASPSILQTSGIKVVFNTTQPAYSRVQSLKVLCRFCDVPRYNDIEDETWYRVILNNFLLENGDNFAMLRDNMRNHKVGIVDIDALSSYVEKNSPITMIPPRGRVTFVT